MCVEIYILFTAKFTDHVIAAKCPYDEIPSIFKRGNPFSGERWKRNTHISLNQFVFEYHFTLITQRITFKDEIQLIYMLGHLGDSSFK